MMYKHGKLLVDDTIKSYAPKQGEGVYSQLCLVGQWRSLGIDSCTKLLVEHVETIAVVLDHAKVVDDVLGVLLFFYLLIYKPFEHALCGIVILLGSECEEIVDEGGNLCSCAKVDSKTSNGFSHVVGTASIAFNST